MQGVGQILKYVGVGVDYDQIMRSADEECDWQEPISAVSNLFVTRLQRIHMFM